MTLSKNGTARLKALALSFVMMFAVGMPVIGVDGVSAQSQKPVLVIDVPSIFEFDAAEISTFAIVVKPESEAPKRSILLIRGLPSTVALTEGRLFGSGVWSVKLTDLPNLKIVTPSSTETSNITISLVTLEGAVLAEKSAILSIAAPLPKQTLSNARAVATSAPPAIVEPAPKPANGQRANSAEEAVAALPVNAARSQTATGPIRMPRQLSFEEMEKVQVFMQKGEENMRSGNINLARLFYKRSADAGWAPGALALAGTYDAEELASMSVVGGIQPDPSLAKKWYEAARDLGSATAQQKLQRLGQR
jgi:hypothetical protein